MSDALVKSFIKNKITEDNLTVLQTLVTCSFILMCIIRGGKHTFSTSSRQINITPIKADVPTY